MSSNICSSDFESRLNFLAQYSWVYDFPLTQFLERRVWEYAPEQWLVSLASLSNEELNAVPYGCTKSDWPESLQTFVKHSLKFSSILRSDDSANPALTDLIDAPTAHLSKELQRGMNPKKQHEVSRMAALVGKLCVRENVKQVVDVGSGLGYLGQVLCSQFALKVLGLESKDGRTHGATNMAANKKALCHSELQSTTFELQNTQNSFELFNELLDEHFPENVSGCSVTQNRNPAHMESEAAISCKSENEIPAPTIRGHRRATNTMSSFEATDTITSPGKISTMSSCTATSTVASCSSNTMHTAEARCSSGATNSDLPAKSDTLPFKLENARVHASDSGTSCSSAVPVCMVGLHSCADLTPTMLKLFCETERLKCLVCFGCCYHNMKKDSETGDSSSSHFVHFPLSDTLKIAYRRVQCSHPKWSISQFALRLAAQETRARWQQQTSDEHRYHAVNVAYRAVLEIYCRKAGVSLQKRHRRVANRTDYLSFSHFLSAVLDRTSISTHASERVHDEILEVHEQYEQYFKFIEPFTCLQVMLQGVLESLVLLDRQCYLYEHNVLMSHVLPVFDDAVSPRSVAIVAWK